MTSRKRSPVPGGELELALLSALWRRAGATARELHEELVPVRGIVYTTVAKVLDRLVEKRMVARRRRGRAFVFRATVGREETQRAIARNLIEQLTEDRPCDSKDTRAPRPAVAALLGALEDVSPELLDELSAELRERRERGDGA